MTSQRKRTTRVKKVEEPVAEVEEIEEDDEYEDVEELPLGDDSSVLFADNQEKSLEIIHAGKRWIFKYKEMTWGEKYIYISCIYLFTILNI